MRASATASQLRAARNALKWSIEKLARASGVSMRTIIRYEDADGIPPNRSGNLLKLIETLETAGIEFIVSPGNVPGILIHAKSGPDTT